jgi:hypothetical protein
MSRYIAEYNFTTAGGKLTVPESTRFIAVVKVGRGFVLITEVWGNPSKTMDIDLKVFHKEEYMLAESIYIGFVLAGSTVFHFSYTREVEDRGGDGGEIPVVEHKEIPDIVLPAGGMEVC